MIGRNVTLDAELVEQRLLHHRPLAHHRLNLSCSRKTESGLQTASNSDFFNTIRQKRPSRRASLNNRNWTDCGLTVSRHGFPKADLQALAGIDLI